MPSPEQRLRIRGCFRR